jgi:hypothetical protein
MVWINFLCEAASATKERVAISKVALYLENTLVKEVPIKSATIKDNKIEYLAESPAYEWEGEFNTIFFQNASAVNYFEFHLAKAEKKFLPEVLQVVLGIEFCSR